MPVSHKHTILSNNSPSFDDECTVLEITIPNGGEFGFDRVDSSSMAVIDWGDGAITSHDTKIHHYHSDGRYTILIDKNVYFFRIFDGVNPQFVTGFSQWGTNISSASNTFRNCVNLHLSKIPDWRNVKNATNTYNNCPNITASTIPEWGNVEVANGTFYKCVNLQATKIPKWGDALKSCAFTYSHIPSLKQVWKENLTETDLMPSRITSHTDCFTGTDEHLRSLFYEDWGGTRLK